MIKAITIRQPHAQLILLGVKTVELRRWATRHRGQLLICAGARADYELGFPRGVVLALVDLVDIAPYLPSDALAACSRWRRGLMAWRLENPRAVAQTPLKGRLGLFSAPSELARTGNPPASAPGHRDSDRAGIPARA